MIFEYIQPMIDLRYVEDPWNIKIYIHIKTGKLYSISDIYFNSSHNFTILFNLNI